MITAYSILSIITFIAYGCDKFSARRGGERINERTLHLLALCGGWPGGLAGQLLFRHKTRKTAFQLWFWLAVLINGALLIGWRAQHFYLRGYP